MPELPEVETVKEILKQEVLGKKIESIFVLHPKTIVGDANEFSAKLVGASIKGFSRVGKFIVFHFDNGLSMASHLRMEGKYFLREKGTKYSYHDMVIFSFTDNTYLAYNDTRRFGTLELVPTDKYLSVPPLSLVGPDPFMIDDENYLVEKYKDYKGNFKAALTDQKIVSGIGNIYADEILFAIGVHPETPTRLVSEEKIKLALKESKRILEKAVKLGGSTIKSYHPKDGMDGNFQLSIVAYDKEGEVCPRCGAHFRKIFVNGRGSTFCPHCQKNPQIPFVLGLTGKVGAGKSLVGNYLKSKGWNYISADEIVHELYKDKDFQKDVIRVIPSVKILNGAIDRVSLRNSVINNSNLKQRLEKYVWKKVEERFIKLAKKSKSKIVFEVPLLFESRLNEYCDVTLLLDCTEEVQLKNLKKRGSSIDLKKINSNFDIQNNIKKATYVVNNNSDVASLYKSIDLLSI